MQSLASLMSVKPADVGNLDDFNESDEEEDKKSVGGAGRRDKAVGLPLTVLRPQAPSFISCPRFSSSSSSP